MELCVGDVGTDGRDGVQGDAEALLGIGMPEEAVLCVGSIAGGDVVRLILPEAHLVNDVLGDDVVPHMALWVHIDVQELHNLLACDATCCMLEWLITPTKKLLPSSMWHLLQKSFGSASSSAVSP